MRALKAIIRNAFRNNGAGGATASLPVGVALLLTGFVIFSLVMGAWYYSWRWYWARPEPAAGVEVVNPTDSFMDFLDNLETEDYRFIIREHPYVFDVATFSSFMKEDDAVVTIVFDKDGNLLTFYPPDKLEYYDIKEGVKTHILDNYASFLKIEAGIPVSEHDVFNGMVMGEENPDETSTYSPVFKSLAYMLIPLTYFIIALYACMTKGTNVIAGAKEQNAFAAILMTPVPRYVIVLGNIIGVWLSSMIPAFVISIPLLFVPMYRSGVLLAFIMISVLSFFIASLVIMISVMSNNVISAQTAFLPVFFVFILLCITCMQNIEEFLGIYEYIPLYGQYLGIALALTGEANYIAIAVSTLNTLLMTALCIYVSIRLLGSERFTVSVLSISDREVIRAKKQAIRDQKRKEYRSTLTSVYGYRASGRLNSLSFSISQFFRPLVLLSVFQLLAMIPPLLLTNGDYLTNIMYSLRSVKSVGDVLTSGADIIGVLMSTPAFLLSMALGYALIIAYYCIRTRVFERCDLGTGLGFKKEHIIPRYLSGLAAGLVMIASVFLILVISGQIKVTGFGIPLSSVPLLLSYMLMWLIQGACEEVMFRGYMMPRIASRFGLIPAIAASSLLFCIFHGLNPGFSVLAFINLILISVLYALISYYTGNIWIVCAAHTMWNFTQGNVFGLEVSGNSGGVSLIHTTLSSSPSSLMTGGGFGPEGGLPVTIVTVVAIIIVVLVHHLRQKKAS
ncbi:MAG: CPBP family intramembrane metalloprotease [Clostridiales bacterium]|nr:CPBP family intramembrane metalloprotease [Clostridiales bacterium]